MSAGRRRDKFFFCYIVLYCSRQTDLAGLASVVHAAPRMSPSPTRSSSFPAVPSPSVLSPSPRHVPQRATWSRLRLQRLRLQRMSHCPNLQTFTHCTDDFSPILVREQVRCQRSAYSLIATATVIPNNNGKLRWTTNVIINIYKHIFICCCRRLYANCLSYLSLQPLFSVISVLPSLLTLAWQSKHAPNS